MRILLYPFLFAGLAAARTVAVSDISQLFHACQTAAPGDEIVIAKGIYTIRDKSRLGIVSRPGPVTVRGATGNPADVVIQGSGQDNETVQTIFELTDSPQWTFRDLTTRDSYYHGFKFNGSSTGCVLRHLVMRDHGESGVKGASTPGSDRHPDNLLVENCDIGFTGKSGGTRDVVEGIDGVAVKGWVVRNCRFLNVQKHGEPAYAVFTKGNSQDTVIEKCRFENCFIGASFGGGGTGAAYFRDDDRSAEHRGGAIRGNAFSACTDAAIYINKGRDCTIRDNTMTNCAANIELRYPESTASVSNNTATGSTAPLVKLRDGATLVK
jgi:hypothetical protein